MVVTKSKFLSLVLVFGTVCNASPDNTTTHLKPNIKREFVDCIETPILLNPVVGAAIAGGIAAIAIAFVIAISIQEYSDTTQTLQSALKFFPTIPASMYIGGLAGNWHQESSKRIIRAETDRIEAYTALLKLEHHINATH